MKIVVTSDWHGDWVSYGVRRFAEIESAVWASVRDALELRASYFFLGDLSNPDSGAGTIRSIMLAVAVAARLAEEEIHSFWVSGNHDVIEDGSGDTTLSPLRGLPSKFVHVIEHPMRIDDHPGFTVLGLPYPSFTKPYDPSALDLPGMLADPNRAIVVASHLTNIEGIPRGEESSEMQRGRDVRYPVDAVGKLRHHFGSNVYAFQGHYHRRTTMTFPGFRLEIPGSVARLTFGEERHDPSYLIAEIE